jgi:ElaB/YqjD/DUF883 family membrane-anchored ribosome-binding protein
LPFKVIDGRLCQQTGAARLFNQKNTDIQFMETHFDAMEKSMAEVPKERLIRDLRILARDAEELMIATAAEMGERAKDARKRLQDALNSLDFSRQGLEAQAASAAKATDKLIREYPYPSLGVAFGFGVLLGLWLNRR